MAVEAGQLVRLALGAWLDTLGLTGSPAVVSGPPDPGQVVEYPTVSLAWGPVTSSLERVTADGWTNGGARASGLAAVLFDGAVGDAIPAGARFTIGGLEYETMAPGWAALFDSPSLVGAILPLRAVAVGAAGNIAGGAEHPWTRASSDDFVKVAGFISVGPAGIIGGEDAGHEAAVRLLGYDEAEAVFVLRANDAESADALAHEFRGAFAMQAAASNDGGDPVLHFAVMLAGQSRTGKVYLDGTYNPPAPEAVAEKSLYVQRVDARVVYPRFWAERAGEETGEMLVSIDVNGVVTDLEDLED